MSLKQKIILLKRRFDRGKSYYGYIQMVSTAMILVGVFDLKKWYWIIGIIVIFMVISYLMGFLDDGKILEEEQRQYSEKNPVLMEILKKLKELEKK